MSSDKETMDGGEKPEERASEVDKKAENVGEMELEKVEEIEEAEDEGKDEDEENIQKKGSKIESGELKSPASERPTRERKTVERFKGDDTPRSSASKIFTIEKGRGIQLKDIPNVAFKLSKRKADENLQLLHSILFGKKAKVHTLKKNIGLFSGFIWAENEEKQKLKVKEKVDKCVKEKLLDFCDILNISVSKASVKKEEIVAKLVAFLESPHATTGALLAEKVKCKKRKSKGAASKSPSSNVADGKSAKKRKLDSQPGKKHKSLTEEEDDDKSQPSVSEDDCNIVPEAESKHKDYDLEDETDKDEDEDGDEDEHKKQKLIEKVPSKKSTGKNDVKSKYVKKRSPAKASKAAGKPTHKSSTHLLKKGAEAKSERKVKEPMTKKQKNDKESEKVTKTTSSEKDEDDSENDNNDEKEPTKEEMHAAVVDLLRDVDFNTATLSDILKKLGNHFGLDLIHRKSEVKDIITEVIQAMSEDEDDSGNDEDDEA